MTALAYRLTLYAPPSVDPTEATVLTPPATAADGTARAHADGFRVATVAGVATYQPYLGTPTIRWGSINPVTGAADIGYCSVPIVDVRTGSGNAQRWVSAFLGDAQARSAMMGCRAVLEESTNGAAGPWSSVFVGRVQGRSLSDVLTYGLEIRESAERLKAQAFVGRPHASVTYAWHGQLWPHWNALRVGTLEQGNGVMANVTGTGPWTLTDVQQVPTRNLVSATFGAIGTAARPWSTDRNITIRRTYLDFSTTTARQYQVRARSDSGLEYGVTDIDFLRNAFYGPAPGQWRVTAMTLATLPVGTLGYTASAPDRGGWRLVTSPWVAPTPAVPLQITDVHPVTLWRDLLAGRFGVLDDAGAIAAARVVAVNSTMFTAAESWALQPIRAIITEPVEMAEWIERSILLPNRLSYRVNGDGQIEPVRLSRLTSVAGLATVGDAAALAQPSWSESTDGALERLDVTARVVERDAGSFTTDGLLDVPAFAVRVQDAPLLSALDARSADVSTQVLSVDAATWQTTTGESADVVTGHARRLATDLLQLTGTGLRTITVTVDRSVTVRPGDWVIVQTTATPNPARNERGNDVLALCVGRSDEPMQRTLTLVDAGRTTAAAVPTSLGGVTQTTDTLTVLVTRNAAADDVELEYAITPTSVSTAPPDDDARWRAYQVVSANGTAAAARRPSHGRVWIRGRSAPSRGALVRQRPSAWVAPTPAFFDVTVLGTVSSLTATEDGATETYDLAWTNTDTRYPVLVEVLRSGAVVQGFRAAPATTTYRVYHVADPRSTEGVLLNGTAYTFRVRLETPDTEGGGLQATVNVTTGTATPPAAASVTASITDASPGGNMSQATITYTSSGGPLTVTKNGTVVTPGASPWTVTRPTDPSQPDGYVFSVTPANTTNTLTARVDVLSNFVFVGNGGTSGGLVTTATVPATSWSFSRESIVFTRNVLAVTIGTLAGDPVLVAAIPLRVPTGAIITSWRTQCARTNAAATVSAKLIRVDASALPMTSTDIGAADTAAAAATVTEALEVTGLSETAITQYAYVLAVTVTPSGGSNDSVSLYAVSVTYRVPSLAAGIG